MASCIKFLANRLLPRPKRPRQSPEKKDVVTQSDEYFKDLHNIWNLVYEMDRPYLSLQALDSLHIKCHSLPLNHDGSYGPSSSNHLQFFSPMPLEQLRAYNIDTDDEDTRERHREEEDFWAGEDIYELDTLSECYLMCDFMSFRFASCAMRTSDARKVKLKELTDWKRRYEATVFWFRTSPNLTHIVVSEVVSSTKSSTMTSCTIVDGFHAMPGRPGIHGTSLMLCSPWRMGL